MTNFSGKNLNVACDGPKGGGMDSRRNALEQVVPVGYKQTEVGVIPEDWNLSNIKDISLVPMQNGLFYEPKRKGSGIPLINVADMYKSAPIDKSSLELFEATLNEKKSFRVNSGDLFFTRSSVVPSGIAFCNIFEEDNAEVVFDSHLIRVRPNTKIVDARFLYLNCIAKHSRNALIAEAKTATMTTIDQSAINRCPVLVPPLKEQTAIANALSDVDALLTELEKLIAKKQAIKTATMQQLLTGKTRLPQYATYTEGEKQGQPKGTKPSELGEIPEDWDVYKLPDVVWYQEGPGLRKWQFKTKGLKVINVTNLQQNGFLDLDKTDRHVSWDEYEKTYKHFACDEGDLVIASSGNSYCKSSTVRKCDLPLLMNTSVIRFKPVGDFSKGFMDVYLKSPYFKDQIDLLITGGAQPNFGPAHLDKIKIPAPSNPEEQTAIATILSDMDNEIQTLEQRLAKTRQIKQGMMQELLTGRIRLPFDKEQ
ncbi:MAG: restriction endonuclease subunit S [Pseudoalteromonas tetraodonis]|nr:restriction endonuclease subunit S [Pseudoalteromonas tetraodonis]